MRTFVCALGAALLFAAGAGCGDDVAPGNLDLALPAPYDLSAPAGSCSAGSVRASCGNPSCAACLLVGGSGVCVTPCMTGSSTGCPSGQTCRSAVDDGGISSSLLFDGTCTNYDGFCA